MLKLIDEWTFLLGASKHTHAHTDTPAHTHSAAQDLFHTLAPDISTLWLIHYTLTDPSFQRMIRHSPPLLSTKPFSAWECTVSSQPIRLTPCQPHWPFPVVSTSCSLPGRHLTHCALLPHLLEVLACGLVTSSLARQTREHGLT